jgi:hypothetical protein
VIAPEVFQRSMPKIQTKKKKPAKASSKRITTKKNKNIKNP